MSAKKATKRLKRNTRSRYNKSRNETGSWRKKTAGCGGNNIDR
jgi:predicted secreted protein